jgi:hypothetical protein
VVQGDGQPVPPKEAADRLEIVGRGDQLLGDREILAALL